MCFDDRSISITEREFCEELSPSWAEQLAVVGVVGTLEDSSGAVFVCCPFFDECLPCSRPRSLAAGFSWILHIQYHAQNISPSEGFNRANLNSLCLLSPKQLITSKKDSIFTCVKMSYNHLNGYCCFFEQILPVDGTAVG